VQVSADAGQGKTYGDADPALTYAITGGSLVTGDAFTGSLTRDAGEHVGSYAINQGTLGLSDDYALTFVGSPFTITARAVQLSADAGQGKTYGDADPALTYTITSGALVTGDAFTGRLTRDAGEHVGSYAITQGTLGLSDDYALTFVGSPFTITARAVQVSADAGQGKTYGDADPALTYAITGGSLVTGDAFTGSLTRDAGEHVGSYAITQGTLGLSGDYALTFIGSPFTITARAVQVTADAGQGKTYGDADPALTYAITSGSLVTGDAFTGSLTRDAGEHVGSYAITQGTLGLSDDYALTFVGSPFTITARAVQLSADAGQGKTYGDADPALTYAITSGSLVAGDAFTGSLTRDAGEHVGSYAITQGTLGLSDDYALTFIGSPFTITARAVQVTADAGQGKTYGDADPALTYAITSGSLVPGDSFTGALSRDAGEHVGSYAVHQGTLAISSDYALSFVGTDFTVSPRAVQVAVASGQSKAYGDPDPVFGYSLTTGSLVAGDQFAGVLARDPGEHVGAYSINQGSLTLGPDYAITFVSAPFTINPRSVSVTASPAQGKVYGDADPALAYAITSGSLVTGDAFTGSLTRGAGEHVGSYAITQGTLGLSDDYALTFVGSSFTIATRSVEVTADPGQSKVYGDADPALTYTITSGALVTGDAFTGSLTRDAGEHVGSYAITQGTLGLSDDYALTFIGSPFTITARAVQVTADAGQGKTYGDADPALTYAITSGSLVPGDSFTGNLDRDAGQNVGNYGIHQGTLSLSSDYNLSVIGSTFAITPRALQVTATPQSKIYGMPDPALTYAITAGALVSGDSFSGSLARTPGENVGTYPTLQGTLSAGSNYNISFVASALTITPRPITITANPQTKVVGSPDPVLTYSISAGSLVGTDALTGSLTRAPGESVGSYPITQGSLTAGTNYLVTFVGATLTITPATTALTLTSTAPTAVPGQPVTFTATLGSAGGSGGTIVFKDGGTLLATVPVVNGVATYTTSALALGNHTITAALGPSVSGGTAFLTERIVTAAAEPDSLHPGRLDLFVGGTAYRDEIEVGLDCSGQYHVEVESHGPIERQFEGSFTSAVGRIVVYAGAGDDNVQIDDCVRVQSTIYGGDGNDLLHGGSGPNVLVGGSGDDKLIAGSSRDILIGGAGSDQLIGAAGDDILIGGSTDYDANDAALDALMAEWSRSGVDYATRVAHLTNPAATGGVNGAFRLTAATVHSDASPDKLNGGSGMDLYFLGACDKLVGQRKKGEVVINV
jgi:hypothetical protein